MVSREEVAALVKQLGDRDYWLRDQSQRQLLARGPDVLRYLPGHLSDRNPETRRRVLSLLHQLEEQRDMAPSRVDASFHHAKLTDVFARIRWQTGQELVWGGEKDKDLPRFTGTFRNVTYWEAVDQLATALNARPQVRPYAEDTAEAKVRTVTMLFPAGKASRHVHRVGAFRVSVHGVSQHRVRDLDDDNPPEYPLRLELLVQSEPRFRLAELGEPMLQKAVDEAGRSLLPNPPEPDGEELEGLAAPRTDWNAESGGAVESVVSLASPAPEARRVALLQGKIPARILIGYNNIILCNTIEKGATFSVHGTAQEITGYWYQAKANRMQLQIRPKQIPGKGMDETSRLIHIYNLWELLHFEDDEGNPCTKELTSSLFAGILLQVNAAQRSGKKASRVVIREPRFRSVQIPFEFRNIPLP
jgi:hypothetical protein